MEDKIAILIPTRKRLNDFILFADSWKQTNEGNSVVIVGYDEDDNTYDHLISQNTYPFIWEKGKCKPFLHILNDLANKYCTKYKYLAFFEDDVRFVTPKWESRIINKIKELGNTAFVWCDDSLNKEKILGVPFFNSLIIQKLGHMSRPEFNTQVVDLYWTELAKKMGTLYYFNDIIIEHRHYITRKRTKDETSVKVQIESVGDTEYYNSQKYKDDFQTDYEKLKEL